MPGLPQGEQLQLVQSKPSPTRMTSLGLPTARHHIPISLKVTGRTVIIMAIRGDSSEPGTELRACCPLTHPQEETPKSSSFATSHGASEAHLHATPSAC